MNLATIANSRIGRPVLVYAFGTACLQVLKQTRTVIEMGFGILDAKFASQPQIRAAEIDAQPLTPPPAGDPLMVPDPAGGALPDHPYAYSDAAVPPPSEPPAE